MRVIPAIDIMGGSVVRLVKGNAADKVVYSSDPVAMAKKWEAAGADMLHVVDLDAAFSSGNNTEVVQRISESVKIPVQFAGGIRSQDAAEAMLAKAARVVIGTMAYSDQDTVRKLAKKNPGRIIVSIDQSGGTVMVKGWKESAGVKVADAISQFRSIGIDEFLLTSIEDVIKVRCAGCASVILGKAMYDGKVSVERAKAVA